MKDRYSPKLDDEDQPKGPSAADIYLETPPLTIPYRKQQGGAVLKDGQLTVGAFTLTESGLAIADNATQDDWGKVGELLFKLEGSIQWLIGDWLVYGENLEYGDLIVRVETTGRDYNTVRNYMVVCRAFELSRRRYNLSFGHYQSATSLTTDEQHDALYYAEKNKLSVAAFRKMVQEHLAPNPEPLPLLPTADNPSKVVRELDKFFKKRPTTESEKFKARNAIKMMRRHLDDLEKDCL